jgi:pimeloyl-ACP methyl ester carboxylesterase
MRRAACILLALTAVALSGGHEACAERRVERLSLGDVSYELLEPGDGRPSRDVVLIPGYAVPMTVWDRTTDALVHAGFRVLRFDLYGRGRSARPLVVDRRRIDYTPELFADQVHELAGKLKISRPFHVIASSMGGPVAAMLAARHPNPFDRVILVSPAGLAHDFPAVTTVLKTPWFGEWYFRRQFRDIMLEHLRDNLLLDPRAYPDMLREYQQQLTVPGSAQAMLSTFHHTLLRDASEEFRALGRLRRPTLVLWGEADKVVALDRVMKTLVEAMTQLELWTIHRAAHLPQLERPQVFNDLAIRFLLRP